MKLNKLFLMGAIALGLVACNNDEVINKSSNEGEKAYLSIALNLPSGKLKSATRATEPGTAVETQINNVRVVLYNSSDVVAYALDLNITGTGSAAPTGTDVAAANGATQFKTKAQEVVKGTYKVYVFINPNAAVTTATATGSALTALEEAKDFAINDVTGASRDNFMMSNADGAVTANVTATTPIAAEANPFSVRLDRAVAKIVLFRSANVDVAETGATVTFTGWDVDNTNKKYFLVRKLTNDINGVMETAATVRENRYAEDPNFEKLYGDNRFMAPYLDNFNYLGTVAAPTPTLGNAVNEEASATTVYVAENTNEADGQYELQSTMVAISAVYTPQGYTEGETWVTFVGRRYTKAEINGFLADPSTIVETAHPTGFKAAIEALNGADYGTLTSDIDAITPENIKKATDNLQFYVYKNGVCYYKSVIKHFDLTDHMAYGKYGVVRNNVYYLTINNVDRAGAPYLGGTTNPFGPDPSAPDAPNTPGTDPSDPNDKEKTYISLDIQVLPWVIREQTLAPLGGS